jgi:hypothetical protein
MQFIIPTIIAVLFGLALTPVKQTWLKLSLLFVVPPIATKLYFYIVSTDILQANDAPMELVGIIVLSGYWIFVSTVTIILIGVLAQIRK